MAFPGKFVDQMGREIFLPAVPQRIISLCPSLTETLVHLGLGSRLVGRTRFCIHPAEVVSAIPHVGGTKDVRLDRVRSLQPDLIIGEKEENTPEMIAALAAEFPVFMTDVLDLASAQAMVRQLGEITDTSLAAAAIEEGVRRSWANVRRLQPSIPCLYFIWKSPWMVVGSNTFIDSVLENCGFDNVARTWEGRYPVLDEGEFLTKMPPVILLSTEPFPFKQTHLAEIQKLIPSCTVQIVDGEMFSWYGSRMVGVENYLNLLLDDIRSALSLQD